MAVGTVMRVKCNGSLVKAIFHRGLQMEDLAPLEQQLVLSCSFEDLCATLRACAVRTRQTLSIVVEGGRGKLFAF
jgi:hypothetical protein